MKLPQILGISISSAAVIILFLSGRHSQGAGALTPPGPPNATMVSLDELSAQITAVQNAISAATSSEKNVGAIGTSQASVWDSQSGTWITTALTSSSGTPQIIESKGNFCGAGSSQVSAWSNETKTWYTLTLTGPTSLARSNGNFCAKGVNQAAVWNQVTKGWTIVALTGSGQAAGADH